MLDPAYRKTITLDYSTLFEIVNALRDKCGCKICERNADALLSAMSG